MRALELKIVMENATSDMDRDSSWQRRRSAGKFYNGSGVLCRNSFSADPGPAKLRVAHVSVPSAGNSTNAVAPSGIYVIIVLRNKPSPGKHETAVVEETIHAALDHGINLMDLFMPGEEVRSNIGRALAGRRDRIMIQGHICSVDLNQQYDISRDPAVCRRYFETLLRCLKTDYIDFGMLFFVDSTADYSAAFESDIPEYAQDLKRRGVIRAIGASSHNPVTARRIVESGAGKLISPEHTPFCKPLTVAQCIHYVLTRPAVVSALVGCCSARRSGKRLDIWNSPTPNATTRRSSAAAATISRGTASTATTAVPVLPESTSPRSTNISTSRNWRNRRFRPASRSITGRWSIPRRSASAAEAVKNAAPSAFP